MVTIPEQQLSEEEKEKAKEKIKQILREYPILSSRVDIELSKADEEFTLDGVAYDQPSGGATNSIYSSTESHVMEVLESEDEAKQLMMTMRLINNALRCLSKKEHTVIKAKYFDKITDYETSVRIDRSRTTVHRYEKSALDKLIKAGLHKIETKMKHI